MSDTNDTATVRETFFAILRECNRLRALRHDPVALMTKRADTLSR